MDAYLADPLCGFLITAAMFRDMMGGLQFIADRNNLSKMAKGTPVYFLSGDHDPVGSMGRGVRKVDVPCRGVQGRHRKALPRRPPRNVQRDQPPGGLPGPAGLAGKQTDMIQGEGRPLSLFFPE